MQPPSLDLVKRAVGFELAPRTFSYNERDVALYALGIGAPADPLDQDELKFVYELSERGFQVFPTFAVVFSHEMIRSLPGGDIAGIKFNPMKCVHGEQFLRVYKPLPRAATVRSTIKIADIFDKGSGLLMVLDITSRLANGEKLAAARQSLFFRDLGGYGGERGPAAKRAVPNRGPDILHEEPTHNRQALLYRLAGDDNPLHVDPPMAARGNYEKPILHGLCTMGFAVRAILKRCGGNDPSRFESVSVRFSKQVFPGDTLRTEIWRATADEIHFQAKVKERDALVLSQGLMRLRD